MENEKEDSRPLPKWVRLLSENLDEKSNCRRNWDAGKNVKENQ